jgi:hypothetical protein
MGLWCMIRVKTGKQDLSSLFNKLQVVIYKLVDYMREVIGKWVMVVMAN